MYKAVLFDGDGTLFDSLPTMYNFYKDLCYEHGKDYSIKLNGEAHPIKNPTDLRRFMIEPHTEMYNLLGFNFQRDRRFINRDFERCMLENIPPLFPGILEVLKDLKDRGIKLGLVTALSFSSVLKARLKKNGITDLFDEIVINDGTMRSKPAPDYLLRCLRNMDEEPNDSAYAGDMPSDVIAGRATGTKTIAVSYGFGTLERLVDARPDYLARNIPMLRAGLGL